MARLYSISLCAMPAFGTAPIVIDNKLSTLGDWIRFNQLQWFLFSDRSKADIAAELTASIVGGDQVIVAVVAPEFAQGHAPNWVWNWLNEKMAQQVINS